MEPPEPQMRRPTAEEVFAPWELVGRSRRDALPSRTSLLNWLGYASVLAVATSFICSVLALATSLICSVSGLVVGPSLIALATVVIGLALGLATWLMARRDLRLMRDGAMDRSGFHGTEKARSNAHAAVVLSLISAGIWPVLVAIYVVSLALSFRLQ